MNNEKVFIDTNPGSLIENEIIIDEPEIVNKYKTDGKEIMVITGRNPKCPAGYELVQTNINEKASDTNVIICSKNIDLPGKVMAKKSGCKNTFGRPNNCIKKGLDWQDVYSLGVSDKDYQSLDFAFIQRDDAFADKEKIYIPAELMMVFLLCIICILYIINNYGSAKPAGNDVLISDFLTQTQ